MIHLSGSNTLPCVLFFDALAFVICSVNLHCFHLHNYNSTSSHRPATSIDHLYIFSTLFFRCSLPFLIQFKGVQYSIYMEGYNDRGFQYSLISPIYNSRLLKVVETDIFPQIMSHRHMTSNSAIMTPQSQSNLTNYIFR